MQDRIAVGRHGKTEIDSGFTTFLQPRFDTVGFLVVPKMEENVERIWNIHWHYISAWIPPGLQIVESPN
ncbi:hypothetical protein TNCV_3254591 [Trichonephila clavipes]|nr:hypothetical protein TNCV_3254591 [Trichonephila clavipes]